MEVGKLSDLEKKITAKMILDDSGYSETMKGINSELRNNKSELTAATSGLQAYGRSSKNINRVQEALSKQIETQTKKVEVWKRALEESNSKMQEGVKKREQLTNSIEKEEQRLKALEAAYGANNKEVSEAREKIESLKKELDSTNNSLENNAKQVNSYQNNLNRAEAQLNNATIANNRFSEEINRGNSRLAATTQNLNSFGEKASSLGGKLTMGVTMPLVGIGVAAAKVGMDFEAQMSRVQAISGATGEEFEALKNQAIELGQKTAFNSKQAAEGMENLASAGFSTKEIMEAMPGMLDLAASSGEGLAMSSDIAASTLRGFGLAASDAGHVADVLAKNAADTNAAVADTGEAMKYIAPVAHAMGLSLEEVTASIGLMANAGIKGSQAGTTLRAALTRLAKPTKAASETMQELGFNAFDAKGKMLPLDDIIGRLKNSTEKLTDEQKQQAIATIFGQESMSGMLALISAGPEQLSELTKGLKDSTGAADEMARTMQNNTSSSIEQAMGSLETAGIKLLQVAAPTIRSIAEGVENLANKFSQLSPATQDTILKIAALVAIGGPLLGVIGKVSSGVGTLISVGSKVVGVFSGLGSASTVAASALGTTAVAAEGATVATAGATAAAGGLGASLLAVAGPVALAVAGIAAVGYAGYKVAQHLNSSATPAVDLFADKAVYSSKTVSNAYGGMTEKVQTGTIKISEATKKAVGSYLDMDKKASSSLMDLQINSDNFTKETKDKVIKNFTDMSKKSSQLSKEQRDAMTVNFTKLVSDTGTLTAKNKAEIIKQYTEMVNNTKGLTKKQKDQTIKDFTDTLNKSVGVTKKQSEDLQKIYKDMEDKIQAGLKKKNDDEIQTQKDFFAKSNALTAQEEQAALKKTQDFWNNKKKTAKETEDKIQSIIKKAADEHRNITASEAREIQNLQEQMKNTAVKVLSDNEVQSKVILERMKGNSDHITAEMAGGKIKELNKLRDSSVKAANDECDKRIAEAIRMRDETKSISVDQADKLIADAKRQRDETINAAEETRNQAVNKIVSMNSDIANNVNTTTGDTLTNWDKLKNWWNNWHPVEKIFKIFTQTDSANVAHNWTGTSHFKGGLTTLHERGEELYELPTGTKIYNHQMSEQMVLETARQTAQALIDANKTNNSEKEVTIIVKSYLDKKVVAETTDKVLLSKKNLEGRLLGNVN